MSFQNSDKKQITETSEVKCVLTWSRPNNIQEPTRDNLCLTASLYFRFFMAEHMVVYSRELIHTCTLDNMIFRVLRFGSFAAPLP